MSEDEPWTESVEVPINGILDLHTFRPNEVKELVPDYLSECRAKGILEVRIIHGKGRGQLRKLVHATLQKLPEVRSFSAAEHGNWGATTVVLEPMDSSSEPP